MEFAILAGEIVELFLPLQRTAIADFHLALVGDGCSEVVLA